MSDSYYDDERISYPDADRIVEEYVAERAGQRPRTTSRDVLEWAEVPDVAHNQKRIHDALSDVCPRTGDNWAGRTVFALPGDSE